MQITITGPRGGGATTLAIEIAKMLSSKGIEVRFKSHDAEAEQERREAMTQDSPSTWVKSKVTIVEGMEQEDEQRVRHFRALADQISPPTIKE